MKLREKEPGLFDKAQTSRFEKYNAEHPDAYRMFCRYAHEAIRAGAGKLGAKMVAERVRWQSRIMTGMDGYRINNNMTAFFARKFMRDYPAHAGIFATRVSVADEELDDKRVMGDK